MASPNHHDITSPDQFKDLLSADLEKVSVLNFWAPWAEPCKQMNEVAKELARKHENILVLNIEAESQAEIAESFEVEAVPSFILLRGHTLLDRISGADASALTKAVARHSTKVPHALSKTTQEPAKPLTADQLPAEEKKESVVPEKKEETEEELNARMRGLMNQSKIVVFMKGTPDAPRCGFSRKTVATLREQGVAFTHFDILSDEAVRQGMKKLNDWPTFPQIIVNGELFGGLDILNESILTGEFDQVKADLKA
ncbi:monothiol glutaredoxin grx4 [Tulasnella sp. 418]|nr:monothiol glutaredoxin grx4 [Tulasnella sp. 418]